MAREIVVRLKDRESTSLPASLEALTEFAYAMPKLNAWRVRLKPEVEVSAALARFAKHEMVASARLSKRIRLAATPNDSYFSSQFGPQRVHAPDAWSLWTPLIQPGSPIILAICDTGVMNTHPDLTNKMLANNGRLDQRLRLLY